MRLLWVGLFSLLAASAFGTDQGSSSDHAQLPRYPGAELVDSRVEARLEQRYPLAALRRLGGQLRYERELQVTGPGRTLLYALPRGEDHRGAFAHSREALRQAGFSLLYWCEGRECGSSALWANNVFENAALNGGDDQQAFALLRRSEAEQEQLIALYAVTRGNRKAYLLAQQVESSALGEQLPVAATVLRLLRAGESLNLPEVDAAEGRWLKLLTQALNQDATLRVLMQGEGAQAWRDALAAAGVRAARLEAEELTGQTLSIARVR